MKKGSYIRRSCLTLFLLLVQATFSFVFAQDFINATANSFNITIDASVFGNGVSCADFNQDGLDDISFCSTGDGAYFLLNNGNGFTPVSFGLNLGNDLKIILWVDYDNDGDKDLFVSYNFEPVQLFRRDGPNLLVDVTESSGILLQTSRNFGACWGDYDADGWLDLYLCKYHNPDFTSGYEFTNHLYHNLGDGTFEEVSVQANVGDGIKASFQSSFFDYDLDGDQDIYVINDRLTAANSMYRNNGDGTFSSVGPGTGTGIVIDAMCSATEDFDNDGDLDIYVTNNTGGSFLLVNNNAVFSNQAYDLGCQVDNICWGALWMDVDNDMDQDLFVPTTGNVGTIELQNEFFLNIGDQSPEFINFEGEMALDDDDYGTYAASKGDFNNDGFSDFVESNNYPSANQLWMNTATSGAHWLKVSIEGTISNRDGIGSWIKVYTGDVVQTQYTFCGESYCAQFSEREMFGLGSNTMIDSLCVTWLSGITDCFYNVTVDTTLHIVEGSSFIPTIDLPDSISLCEGASIELNPGTFDSYLWSTGDISPTLVVTETGDYFVQVLTPYSGYVTSDTISISIVPDIEVSAIISPPSCFGFADGSIELDVITGGALDSTLWSSGESTLYLDSLVEGNYSVFISDDIGCEFSGEYTLNQPDSISLLANATGVSCYGFTDGWVEINASGGTGAIMLDFGLVDPEELGAGDYLVSAIDENDCTSTIEFSITEPEALDVLLTEVDIFSGEFGSASVDVSGGTPPYEISWSTDENGESVDNLAAGDYWVLVSDSNSCEVLSEFTITSNLSHAFQALSVFPNPFSDQLELTLEPHKYTMLEILDPLGKIVYKVQIGSEASLTIGSTLSPGRYYLRLTGTNSFGGAIIVKTAP